MRTCVVLLADGDVSTADDLYSVVISPAFERRSWELERIVPGGEGALAAINEADGVIVDAAVLDAEVAFSCGRRIGSGRPTIVMSAADASPLAGVDTIPYDLSSARSAHDSRHALESSLDRTLSHAASRIEQILRQIDRKLDRALAAPTGASQPSAAGLQELTEPPRERLLTALANDRISEVVDLLPELVRLNPVGDETLTASVVASTAGDEFAAKTLASILDARSADLEPLELRSAIGAIVRFGVRTDREDEVLQWFGQELENIASQERLSGEDRAYLFNQLQMLHWGIRSLHAAEQFAREAIGLDPDEPAYRFNLSLILEAADKLDEAEELVDQYLRMEPDPKGDHLGQAVDIYLKRGRVDEARDLFERLRAIDPERAMVHERFNPDVRRLLDST